MLQEKLHVDPKIKKDMKRKSEMSKLMCYHLGNLSLFKKIQIN